MANQSASKTIDARIWPWRNRRDDQPRRTADSFGLITLIAPERLSLRSSELIAESVELIPQSGADLAFRQQPVSAASPGSVDPAVVSLVAGSDPGAVMVVANTFAAIATFQFEPGVQADRFTIRANHSATAIVGAEDACP